jgi:2-dehydro-3-deoxyphosphogluconate aldolase/(4S)-4-hydroxy-2-oxoglutarate aldolase
MGATLDLVRDYGVITVVNAPAEDRLLAWAMAVARGGVKLIAIPVSFPAVTEIVSDLADEANLTVGISDVVHPDQVTIAVAAGADFVLSPLCDPEIVTAARARGLEVIVGGATPTELARAAQAGPDLVALYPAAAMGGPAYFRTLLPFLNGTPIAVAGGVDVESAPSYLEAGATAAVVDTGVFPTDDDEAATEVITMRAMALTEVVADVLGTSDSQSARQSWMRALAR